MPNMQYIQKCTPPPPGPEALFSHLNDKKGGTLNCVQSTAPGPWTRGCLTRRQKTDRRGIGSQAPPTSHDAPLSNLSETGPTRAWAGSTGLLWNSDKQNKSNKFMSLEVFYFSLINFFTKYFSLPFKNISFALYKSFLFLYYILCNYFFPFWCYNNTDEIIFETKANNRFFFFNLTFLVITDASLTQSIFMVQNGANTVQKSSTFSSESLIVTKSYFKWLNICMTIGHWNMYYSIIVEITNT